MNLMDFFKKYRICFLHCTCLRVEEFLVFKWLLQIGKLNLKFTDVIWFLIWFSLDLLHNSLELNILPILVNYIALGRSQLWLKLWYLLWFLFQFFIELLRLFWSRTRTNSFRLFLLNFSLKFLIFLLSNLDLFLKGIILILLLFELGLQPVFLANLWFQLCLNLLQFFHHLIFQLWIPIIAMVALFILLITLIYILDCLPFRLFFIF